MSPSIRIVVIAVLLSVLINNLDDTLNGSELSIPYMVVAIVEHRLHLYWRITCAGALNLHAGVHGIFALVRDIIAIKLLDLK